MTAPVTPGAKSWLQSELHFPPAHDWQNGTGGGFGSGDVMAQ